jgi:aromatase
MGYIRNAVVIKAPVDEIFRLTNDVRTWPDLFTEYQSSEVIEEAPGDVTFRLTTYPDETGQSWSWIARRQTNFERKSTYSEREPFSGPFARMEIRWWYDSLDPTTTLMTWEQEFTLKPGASVSEQEATSYLNKQTGVQQQVIKERLEKICGTTNTVNEEEPTYRGVIIGRYEKGSEDAITSAFQRSDETELPHILGVKSRHVWVLGDIYMHFVEGQSALPEILKEHAKDPLFKDVKAELDTYVKPLSPDLYPGVAHEIYRWTPAQAKG